MRRGALRARARVPRGPGLRDGASRSATRPTRRSARQRAARASARCRSSRIRPSASASKRSGPGTGPSRPGQPPFASSPRAKAGARPWHAPCEACRRERDEHLRGMGRPARARGRRGRRASGRRRAPRARARNRARRRSRSASWRRCCSRSTGASPGWPARESASSCARGRGRRQGGAPDGRRRARAPRGRGRVARRDGAHARSRAPSRPGRARAWPRSITRSSGCSRSTDTTAFAAARLVASGGIHGLHVAARDALRIALREGASAFVLVHNHPSGDPAPSPEDIAFTRAVERAAGVVGTPLLDHVVIARRRATSMLEAGSASPRRDETGVRRGRRAWTRLRPVVPLAMRAGSGRGDGLRARRGGRASRGSRRAPPGRRGTRRPPRSRGRCLT